MLTCFRLRDDIDGAPLDRFEGALDLDDLGPRQVRDHGVLDGRNFVAQLYTVTTPAHEISWAPFLRAGWPDLNLPSTASAGAVLFVAIPRGAGRFVLALTLGTGHYLLREGAYDPGFGIRAALNIIYEGGVERDPSRLRALDSKRVALNTLRARYQANRNASLETFDVDVMRDILSGITGDPADQQVWGARIDGRDSLTVLAPIDLQELGDLAHRIADASERADYRDGFGWVDNVGFVQDRGLRDELVATVLDHLRTQAMDSIELAIPEVIEWPRIAGFRYSFDRNITRPDIALAHYLAHLAAKGKLSDLDLAKLKRDRVIPLDDSGHEVRRWSVWRCLDAQFEYAGSTFVLDGGDFYRIDDDYLGALDAFLDGVPQSHHELPAPALGEREEDYLRRVSQPPSDFLLLDQRVVRLENRTSPVEICDLLAKDGALIHAKKGRGSSELSHLFSQGFVSAELLLASPEFRERVQREVAAVAAELPSGSPPWPQSLEADHFSSRDHRVVYAIIRKAGSELLRERLPFFSKINLRRSISDLERMGYAVGCQIITTP